MEREREGEENKTRKRREQKKVRKREGERRREKRKRGWIEGLNNILDRSRINTRTKKKRHAHKSNTSKINQKQRISYHFLTKRKRVTEKIRLCPSTLEKKNEADKEKQKEKIKRQYSKHYTSSKHTIRDHCA
jgi:hypothetical protein